MLGTLGH